MNSKIKSHTHLFMHSDSFDIVWVAEPCDYISIEYVLLLDATYLMIATLHVEEQQAKYVYTCTCILVSPG